MASTGIELRSVQARTINIHGVSSAVSPTIWSRICGAGLLAAVDLELGYSGSTIKSETGLNALNKDDPLDFQSGREGTGARRVEVALDGTKVSATATTMRRQRGAGAGRRASTERRSRRRGGSYRRGACPDRSGPPEVADGAARRGHKDRTRCAATRPQSPGVSRCWSTSITRQTGPPGYRNSRSGSTHSCRTARRGASTSRCWSRSN